MPGRLQNKVCLITGTGGGMGRAAATLFAREGARVVGCDLDKQSGEETLRLVRQTGGQMIADNECDLAKPGHVAKLVDLALTEYCRIDVLYNNAAMAWFGWVPEMAHEMFRRTIVSELDIVFWLSQAVWPHLIAAGGGSIINVASKAAKRANPLLPSVAHAAAKGAVISMSRQMAAEGGKHGIRVNTISPGVVRSKQTEPWLNDPKWHEYALSQMFLKRVGEPTDIAWCALFLASDESQWITGAEFAVDGGSTA
ncbi:MAG: SDR family oxidoreductase [Betaproteobacteria bacterium]|nr:MAG: SDR family oxidoreductase [Betaproteobacteria bacterium]